VRIVHTATAADPTLTLPCRAERSEVEASAVAFRYFSIGGDSNPSGFYALYHLQV